MLGPDDSSYGIHLPAHLLSSHPSYTHVHTLFTLTLSRALSMHSSCVRMMSVALPPLPSPSKKMFTCSLIGLNFNVCSKVQLRVQSDSADSSYLFLVFSRACCRLLRRLRTPAQLLFCRDWHKHNFVKLLLCHTLALFLTRVPHERRQGATCPLA